MKIKRIISQYRRDFTAIYECEHCGYEFRGTGRDIESFHQNMIPSIPCSNCGKLAPADYVPLEVTYSNGRDK